MSEQSVAQLDQLLSYTSEYFGTECTVEEDKEHNTVLYLNADGFLLQITLPQTETAYIFYASKPLTNKYTIENADYINEFVLKSEYGTFNIREVSPDNYFYFYTTTFVFDGKYSKKQYFETLKSVMDEIKLGFFLLEYLG